MRLGTSLDPEQRDLLQGALLGRFRKEAGRDLNHARAIFDKHPFPIGSAEAESNVAIGLSNRQFNKRRRRKAAKEAINPPHLSSGPDTES